MIMTLLELIFTSLGSTDQFTKQFEFGASFIIDDGYKFSGRVEFEKSTNYSKENVNCNQNQFALEFKLVLK